MRDSYIRSVSRTPPFSLQFLTIFCSLISWIFLVKFKNVYQNSMKIRKEWRKKAKNLTESRIAVPARWRCCAPPSVPLFLALFPLGRTNFGQFLEEICLNHG